MPPYVIFHDKTLAAMVVHRPESAEALLQLSGVGEAKLERFGEAFLGVIRNAGGDGPAEPVRIPFVDGP